MRLMIILLAVLLMTACSTPRIIATDQMDSVRTVTTERIIYRDTIIEVPVPAEADKALLQDTDTSRLQTNLAESEAFVSGGKLHHTLRNRQEKLQPIRLKLPEKVQSTESTHLGIRTVTVEVERELTRWQKLFLALGQGAFVAGLAVILWFIVRIVRKYI